MKIEQIMIPVTAGTKKDTIAHFQLLASFFIVKSVVEQGQCINENNITLIAVIHVQPFSTNKLFNHFNQTTTSEVCHNHDRNYYFVSGKP